MYTPVTYKSLNKCEIYTIQHGPQEDYCYILCSCLNVFVGLNSTIAVIAIRSHADDMCECNLQEGSKDRGVKWWGIDIRILELELTRHKLTLKIHISILPYVYLLTFFDQSPSNE